jgi:hypothetical protein
MGKNSKNKIINMTVNYAHKQVCKCHHCNKVIAQGNPYFTLVIHLKGEYLEPRFKLCKECLDASMKEYHNKEGKYGEYLKKKIVKTWLK